MAHDDPEGDPPTPERELELAREALAAGDVEHALIHVAGAVGERPNDPEVLAVIDEVAAQVEGDPLEHVPLAEGIYFGAVAVRAYLLARVGRYDEAVALVCQLQAVVPERPFLDWVEWWLALPGVVVAVDPDALAQACERCLNELARHPTGRTLHDRVQDRMLALVRLVRAERPDGDYAGYFHSIRARRAGLFEEAEEVARELHARRPSYLTAVALGGALRERGQLEDAVEAFRAALAHEPDDVAVLLDVGDMLLDDGLLERSLEAYEEALSKQAGQPWALASRCYLRYLLEGELRWVVELERLACSEPTSQRALDLLDVVRPYRIRLDPPRASLVQGAANAWRRGDQLKQMWVSGLEPPSARLIVDWLHALTAGEDVRVAVEVEAVPSPDPRLASHPVAHVIWRYEGHDPVAGVPAPLDPDLAATIDRLAWTPYDSQEWWRRARAASAELGPEHLLPLLGSMVHRPPSLPEDQLPWVWLFRRQLVAALLIAGLDDGWEGSTRQAGLESLLYGPIDWTTSAAILALTWLLNHEQHLIDAVVPKLVDLLQVPRSPIWHACVETPLLHCLPEIAALDSQTRALLEAQRLTLLREQV